MKDMYVIERSPSIAQAQRTKYYIVDESGEIKFILFGSKRDQVIFKPKARKLKYLVRVYRSTRGRAYVKVIDMYEGRILDEVVDDAEGFLKLAEKYPFFEKIIEREHLINFH